ncbi:MAG: GNAT family N-acetyltransferase [Gemmatimonadota bacterium]|nr:GNAT family N-acetyltransferase [Gemmatimonadota bacterium]
MAWPHERRPFGPSRPTARDIDALNRMFADAFTDRYRRDGLGGVRVPKLNPAIWRYALEDAEDGAMIWRDESGALCGFNIAHLSGREGWMGPLAVRTDRQGEGLGKEMLGAAIDWLKRRGAATIGLETMPRTIDNIGFYSSLGFVPRPLTVTLTRDLSRGPRPSPEWLAASAPGAEVRLAECRALTARLAPGVDFTRELCLTATLGLGDTALVRDRDGALAGFALYHAAPLADGRMADEVRVLKLVATGVDTLGRLVDAVEAAALAGHLRRLSFRAQSAFEAGYLCLVRLGYRASWTDLRMTLSGFGEAPVSPGAIVWSNWEI